MRSSCLQYCYSNVLISHMYYFCFTFHLQENTGTLEIFQWKTVSTDFPPQLPTFKLSSKLLNIAEIIPLNLDFEVDPRLGEVDLLLPDRGGLASAAQLREQSQNHSGGLLQIITEYLL